MEISKERFCKVLTITLQHPMTLCCIEVSVNLCEKRDSSAKSLYHWRILKCRQLIFSDSEIIASPILGQESRIYVVLDKIHYENKCFTELLDKLQLSAKEPVPVSKSIYESCLHYTIIAKVAPLWNQVGKYLVNGRRFLECSQLLPAVKMDIYIKDDNLIIMLRSLQVKLWPTKLEDFNIPTNTINNFASKSISTISEIELESQWVYVLPSLKKGKIVYINQHIPASCPYKTYKELRRHWKNMYGYRIPEEENSPYYTISFNLMNPTLYTYPSACVKIHDISTFDSIKEKDILNCFHNDLLKKFPKVFGHFTFMDQNSKTTETLRDFTKPYLNPSSKYLNFSTLEEKYVDESCNGKNLSLSLSSSFTNTQKDVFVDLSSQITCSRNISLMTPNSRLSVQMSNTDAASQSPCSYNSCDLNISQQCPAASYPFSLSIWDQTKNKEQLIGKKYFSADNINKREQIKDYELSLSYDKTTCNSKNTLNVEAHSEQFTAVCPKKICTTIFPNPKTMPSSKTEVLKTSQLPEVLLKNNQLFNLKRVDAHDVYNNMELSFKKRCYHQSHHSDQDSKLFKE